MLGCKEVARIYSYKNEFVSTRGKIKPIVGWVGGENDRPRCLSVEPDLFERDFIKFKIDS